MRLRLAIALALVGCAPAARAEHEGYRAEIEVARILHVVRVVDEWNEPILGLGPHDFRAWSGGMELEVESVEWVPAPTPEAPPRIDVDPQRVDEVSPPRGRLIVMLFQLHFHASRLTGLIHMSHRAMHMLQELGPEDRVALAVFGSHLELHSDFTNDFVRLDQELAVTEMLEPGEAVPSGTHPSLMPHFDVEAAREAANLNQALRVLAEALEPLPGPKSLLLFGHGMGRRLAGGGVWFGKGYPEAVAALRAARTPVYSMDVTRADHHSLEAGLRAMSAATGGFYAKTHLFPGLAMQKLSAVLAGHYELTLVKPRLEEGIYPVQVELRHRLGTVYAQPLELVVER